MNSASTGPAFFSDAQAFRAWLEKHSTTEDSLIVGFYKVGSGKASITWPQSVDEALTHGWIDGVRKRIDDEAYQIRFTRRRAGSIWSAINIARVNDLTAQGRMTKEGLAAFERRTEGKSRVYSYEQPGESELSDNELRAFRKNEAAWAFFEAAPPGYRRQMLHRVTSAKREETRAARFEKFRNACANWVVLE